ncbi:hypothetical protein COU78_01660 [Candidatus Peregrinibacteria bacterium CG10_big_fil_rev_8_21_14_0_10_49_24]|nr:MAG: hypothetical protein COV83_00295 [Candidatus Peregrinibacteria bacterium CG11_big_fil_rev_8_21_14_0_20_49_14]PIR51428.1 MAG: hypothetical protein COU78_01660 [Candidatus Peregrinibacteria bacterium CG10_big_fil_rev_8_21_14_0_10_49_24]PJA67364.1 MAG: hypothetical protein CO157_04890 [Candidatus Peregrinibacteria bacterium CG_4_9_14_3_um_filter_49_12]
MTSGTAQRAARIIPEEISMPARFDAQDRNALMEMVRTLSPESRRSLFSKHKADVYEHSAYERQLLHSMFDDNLRA